MQYFGPDHYYITRKIEFDAGHRIHGHESKCGYYHGHRYVAEITVRSPVQDTLGRVTDFSVLKSKYGGWIDLYWDHNMILHQDDPMWNFHALYPSVFTSGGITKAPYRMECNPTVENLVRELFHNLQRINLEPTASAPRQIHLHHIRLFETPNCWAEHYEG